MGLPKHAVRALWTLLTYSLTLVLHLHRASMCSRGDSSQCSGGQERQTYRLDVGDEVIRFGFAHGTPSARSKQTFTEEMPMPIKLSSICVQESVDSLALRS